MNPRAKRATVRVGPTATGTVLPNLSPPVRIDAPLRSLTNDDLARAYDMGRDLERAAVLAYMRGDDTYCEACRDYAVSELAHGIEMGKHREEKP